MNFAGKRILILEDEPIIAFALEDMLEAEGAEPTVATSLEEADAALADADFEGAILDVNVHGEKSYDFARAVRQKDISLIFATGYGEAAHPAEFASEATVTKPYNLAQIAEAFARQR